MMQIDKTKAGSKSGVTPNAPLVAARVDVTKLLLDFVAIVELGA